jgi:hypothetical protein
MEKMTVYTKEGKTYKESHTTSDTLTIYQRLTENLISKKINSCTYIRSIKRMNLYNGFQRITVYMDNGVKIEYIIKN